MPIYTLKLLNRREVARETIEYSFSKPSGLCYKPGQYAGFTLLGPSETDANGVTRRFSFLSTPHDQNIVIATRIQAQGSAYKRVLNSLPIGSEIKFAGPAGNFTLHEDPTVPAVFLAGGIGITPFYSMIKDVVQRQIQQRLVLFYGNQSINEAAYLDELTHLQNQAPGFNFVPTLTNPSPSWTGETGFITTTLIKKYLAKYLNDLNQSIYYLCGPLLMVKALHQTLIELGVDEQRIKVEDFPGY